MRRILAFTAALALFATLASCAEGDSASPDGLPPLPSESPVYPTVSPSHDVPETPDSEVVLEITWPGIGATGFDYYYPAVQLETEQAALVNDYFKNRAQSFYDAYQQNPGGLDISYSEKYNANGVVSYWLTVVHAYSLNDLPVEEETYSADTVDYFSGVRIALDDVFAVPRDEYLTRLFAAAFAGAYDENANYGNYFETENFCLEADGVTIFFPPATIDDVWVFVKASFSDLSDILADWIIYDKE